MASSCSSILRLISRANSLMSNVGRAQQRAMSSSVVSSSFMKSSSPWLMLPPSNDNMVHNFYSLEQNKVHSLTTNSIKSFMGNDIDDIVYVSSSHGWLTLFNRHNCDLFLFNPLTGSHIKLPPIHTLPIPKQNLRGGFGCITKLITSCSPEQEHCRVMMSFSPEYRLAFCSPRSTEWTPIGALYEEFKLAGEDDTITIAARVYKNFIYSSRHKLFYCITQRHHFEAWDLHDTSSPKCIPMEFSVVTEENYPLEDRELKKMCRDLQFLVVAEDSGDIFIIIRKMMEYMAPDGSYFHLDLLDPEPAEKLPYKTIGFDVYKYDEDKCEMRYMDGSLDGYAFFIGKNQSFAISATAAGLKPNSIYFADTCGLPKWLSATYGGHDIGIFNYKDRTFSPCYYPCDRQSIKRIIPSPMWFTPTN